ncbi:sigma-70 family RNA polymerase sigma factor [Clostridium ganghwense]|uniref:Sigma-70 family RNA polymerase sigma factor n=1 Tax=Clostridium ganghwense TaxID=312089 RepID=A0ABT4CNT6_9CLOT|nr:sigma-70 family RNA polymerase sigma factor [Clostridium ganghwense]MCY6369736.1 sigma-70 family RNA polymerase sigma factor [Clostridium ganghwense]
MNNEDFDLVMRAQKGDDDAFYKLICTYKCELYKIAYSYLNNEQDSLDAIQETTYRAYKNISKLRTPQYFKTWLIRILINYCSDELNQNKKLKLIKHQSNIQNKQYDNSNIEAVELLDSLKPDYKKIILLKYFHDFTLRDIAQIMKKPEGTVKTWLYKALKQLKNILIEEGEDCV